MKTVLGNTSVDLSKPEDGWCTSLNTSLAFEACFKLPVLLTRTQAAKASLGRHRHTLHHLTGLHCC